MEREGQLESPADGPGLPRHHVNGHGLRIDQERLQTGGNRSPTETPHWHRVASLVQRQVIPDQIGFSFTVDVQMAESDEDHVTLRDRNRGPLV